MPNDDPRRVFSLSGLTTSLADRSPGAEALRSARQTSLPASRPTLLFPGLETFYRLGAEGAYALLRIAFGLTIVTHGVPKLTGSAHGSMADPLAGSINLIGNVLD